MATNKVLNMPSTASEIDRVEFDFAQIKAREMVAFFEAAKTSNVQALSEIMAKVITACPWGDPADPDTYLDLPFFGVFQDLIAALGEAAKNAAAR